METKGRENQQNEESLGWFAKYTKSQGDWLEKTKGNLMVTATVIAAMSFQVMVSPPGGVWQNDTDGCSPGNQGRTCKAKAGTAVLALDSSKSVWYVMLVRSSAVSFSASMFFIFLVVVGSRLRNQWVITILMMLMVAAVLCVSVAFFASVALVEPDDDVIHATLLIYLAFWVMVPVVFVLYQLFRLSRWLYRRVCARRQRLAPRLP